MVFRKEMPTMVVYRRVNNKESLYLNREICHLRSTKHLHVQRETVREENMNVEEKLLNIEVKKLALLEQSTGISEEENSLFLRPLLPYFQKIDLLQ